jgi:type II secretory pathway pseudopilin PulG
MNSVNILIPMHLAGQERNRRHQRAILGSSTGYAMVALLVALSVMSILLVVAMPVWRQASQREKEAELVFRGKQYARAIELFQRKMPGALPPNVDLLVDQKYLRKKYKDPITGDDFLLVRQGEGTSGAQPGSPSPGSTTGRQTTPPGGRGGPSTQPGGVVGGIMGVASKSTAASLLIYNGRTKYSEWQFVYVAQTQTPGAGGAPGPGGRGGPRGEGGPGVPPGGPGGGMGGGRSQVPGGGRGFPLPGGRQGTPPLPNAPRRP